jgi:glutamate-5-semialdehyde dehydrogenase
LNPKTLPQAIEETFRALRSAARDLRQAETAKKNAALEALAKNLVESAPLILAANQNDLDRLSTDRNAAFRDRLTLNPKRIEGMAESLRQVAQLPDPVGEIVEQRTLKNGLHTRRVRAPLGVIFMIFESRPNVILEAFSLAFKAGNVIALRGGSESRATSEVIYKLMRETLRSAGFSTMPFYGFDDYDRYIVDQLLQRKDLIDVTVPRGGDQLIEYVQTRATMPIIKNDRGLCHAFVDESADLDMAVAIVKNGKVQRPGVCNSLETVLVHKNVASQFLPKLYAATADAPLNWRTDAPSFQILQNEKNVSLAQAKDFDTEHLDLILNCRVVNDFDEALAHIDRHGSKHSETIISRNEANARRFQQEVDAAAVYWNASTRFTDGFELGLGGELGISTQKLHVRGPVGLKELTSTRWIMDGSGQIRD